LHCRTVRVPERRLITIDGMTMGIALTRDRHDRALPVLAGLSPHRAGRSFPHEPRRASVIRWTLLRSGSPHHDRGSRRVNVNASQGMTMLPHGKLHPDSMSFVCLAIPSSRPVWLRRNRSPACRLQTQGRRSDTIAFLSTTTTAVIFLPGRKFNGARRKQWTS